MFTLTSLATIHVVDVAPLLVVVNPDLVDVAPGVAPDVVLLGVEADVLSGPNILNRI